jgi:hypothetical protein
MNRLFVFGVIVTMIALGTMTAAITPLLAQSAKVVPKAPEVAPVLLAPITIFGDNIYVTWSTNKTGNDEVMFRASDDGGATFADKINLSNTTDADSTRAEIDSDTDSVVVTWWETNETQDTPVMRVSNDNGDTFGPLLKLATNGSIDEAG